MLIYAYDAPKESTILEEPTTSNETSTEFSEPTTKSTKRKRLSRRKRKRRRRELMMVEQAKSKEDAPLFSPLMKIDTTPNGCVEFTHPQWGSIQVTIPNHIYSKTNDDMNYKELLGWDGDC